jgi:hypothetical protein
MITREQYLEALDIVETYHQQFRQHSEVGRTLTPITDWDKFDECSMRLQNILKDIRQGTAHYLGGYYKEEFIENIQIHKMRKMRNCGKKSLEEFIELMGY